MVECGVMQETLLLLYTLIHNLDQPFFFAFIIVSLALALGWYRRSYALGMFASVALAFGTTDIAKAVFHIPRPDHMVLAASGYRFPSLHAAVSGAILGSLWWYAMQVITKPLNRALATLLLVSIFALIAYSRIALNVHEPIDVIVGGAIGVGTSFLINYFVARK